MNKFIIPLAVGMAILAVFAFMVSQRQTAELETLELPAGSGRPPPLVEAEETGIRYPLPELAPQHEEQTQEDAGLQEDVGTEPAIQADTGDEAHSLPTLDESDAPMKEAIATFVTGRSLEALFRMDGFIRRLVVSIDNLPRKQLPRDKYRLSRPTAGRFVVQGEDESLTLSPENFQRYTPIVELIDRLDSDKLIAVYLQYYPLFQEAYEYLGYPSAYFNDRLIDVIDDLLATPLVDGPIRLVRPHVLYRFADPDLEALSAGNKALIRAGPANAGRLKTKLREIRQALTGRAEADELSKEIETGMDSYLNEGAEPPAP